MSMEQSRGAEPPAGGTAAASPDGVKMQILSTEHWSLLATRSLGYTDSFGRANMFFAVLSGAVIALALIAQGGRFDTTFYVAAILLLATVYFVGMATIARIGHLNAEDANWLRGMNRIRHAYLELRPRAQPVLHHRAIRRHAWGVYDSGSECQAAWPKPIERFRPRRSDAAWDAGNRRQRRWRGVGRGRRHRPGCA